MIVAHLKMVIELTVGIKVPLAGEAVVMVIVLPEIVKQSRA
jgi:hypothetical protein